MKTYCRSFMAALLMAAVTWLSSDLSVAFGDTIIDNGDPETSFTGTWEPSGAPNPWDPADPGRTSLWARGGDTYTWTFTPTVTANYAVYMWHTVYSSRSKTVPVSIDYSGGTATLTVNQQINGGMWNLLGSYRFEAGIGYDITIISQPKPASTCADAVRFVQEGTEPPPVTTTVIIDNGGPGTSFTGDWEVSGATDPWDPADPKRTSLWARDGDTYTWTFTPATSGDYVVSMWHTVWSSRSSSVPVSIEYSGGTDAVTINQKINGRMWNILGTYPFEAGVAYDLTVTSQPGPTSTCADAVKFEMAEEVPPGITGQPLSRIVDIGSTATFTVTASGSAPLSYQWQKDGSDIDGATSNSYTTPGATPADNGAQFRCVVTNPYGTATSDIATLTVNAEVSPSVTSHPSDRVVTVGASATFSVAAAGSLPLEYQWQRNGFDIGGATESSYATPPATLADDGDQFRCVVTNMVGSVTSNAATLTVIESAPPAAFNDQAETQTGRAVNINVVKNDTDVDGTIDSATVTIVSGPADGTAVPQPDGSVLYTPDAGYCGKEIFTYTVRDDQGVPSNEATVTVTVGIMIDNGAPQTSFTGSWSVSGGLNPWDPADTRATSLWARGDDTYTWRFTPAIPGNYEISMWHTYAASRGNRTPVDIDYWGGTDTVYVNQLVNSGKWNLIGTYPFSAGVGHDITINALPDPYSTCADAIRFVHIPSNVSPVATIKTLSPNPALPGQVVSFSGSGIDFEGSVTGYSWYSSLDGPLSDNAAFTTSNLSEGVHSIFFKVRDNEGKWSQEVQARVDVNNYPVETTEHIFFAPGYASEDGMPVMIQTLQGLKATLSGGTWTYRNTARNKRYLIHPVTSNQQFIDALTTENSTVLYYGHSNYGLGQLFHTAQEMQTQVIEDIRYVDDDRILNTASPIVHVNINGMRTGQAYPHWWPIYKDGSSAVVPYEKGDPAGDPAYNYYITYRVSGDPTYYKMETVRNSGIERFSDWSGPAWYDPAGNPPQPNNPDHDSFFITNPDPWFPSFERSGNWVDTNTLAGFFRENYDYSAPGNGSDRAMWLFDIPTAGNYYVYAWYPAASTNATNAPYRVNHGSGSSTVAVNQRLNGGQWRLLGTFNFGVGNHSVELSDNASGGNVIADGIRVSHVDNPPEVLRAHFFATERSGPTPLTVTFTSEAVGDVDTFLWDFGDGQRNNTRTFVSHTYAQPGTYTVTYTVNGPLGSNTLRKVGYVVVGATEVPLQAEFESRSSQQGLIPGTIRFRDRSSGNIVSWEWDMDGDGVIDSTEQSPTFTYTEEGIFNVSLTVRDTNAQTATIVKEGFIRMGIFDKNIDNVDYPKTHYRSKTLLFSKGLEVAKEDMKYARMLISGCDSAHYYTDTFQRGVFHYATNTTGEGDHAMAQYLKAYVEGASDYEIWQVLQAIEPLYDYYDFRKKPSEQW